MKKLMVGMLMAVFAGMGVSCSLWSTGEWIVHMPEQAPASAWENDGGYCWQVEWGGDAVQLPPDGFVVVPGNHDGAVVAVAVDMAGFPLGSEAGALFRRYRPGEEVRLRYIAGWTSRLTLELSRRGADISKINLERLEDAAVGATDGRPFLIDVGTAADAVTTNTVHAGALRLPSQRLLPLELHEWQLPYPPRPALPEKLPVGLYTIVHPDLGRGWLSVRTEAVEWGLIAPD